MCVCGRSECIYTRNEGVVKGWYCLLLELNHALNRDKNDSLSKFA